MTGKDILFAALRGERTERPAWVPFVGVHGASIIGKTAREYLTDPELLVAGLLKANELYRPDGLPIIFDLQMEAEVLGCALRWPDEGPPSVTTHPLANAADFGDLPEFSANCGRFPMAFEASRTIKEKIGDTVALYGLLCGPFTLALHLLGNNIFLEMYDDGENVKALIDYCAGVAVQVAGGYIDAGCDVVAVVDPMLSQISEEHFTEFCKPALNKVFDHIRSRNKFSSLFVCGDATRNIEAMCRTNCDNLSVDENVSLSFVRESAAKAGKSFGGNLQLTVALLLGDENAAKRDALRAIGEGGDTGFVLAPGCDMPFATPPANIKAAADMALDSYLREIAEKTVGVAADDLFEDVVLPDYSALDVVTLDVVTLDSSSCPPCQYMYAAAHEAANDFGQAVVVLEHKITTRQGLGMMKHLGVANIPAIAIDGVAKYVSLIPDAEKLRREITEAISRKR